MVSDLEMPEIFAVAGIKREQEIGVQLRALAIGAVEIAGWRPERKESDAVLPIDSQILPRYLRPQGISADCASILRGEY